MDGKIALNVQHWGQDRVCARANVINALDQVERSIKNLLKEECPDGFLQLFGSRTFRI
jgi:hypothetical protein